MPAGDAELVGRLRAELGPQVDASARRRAEYSSDASNYRVVPQAVVFPRTVDDVLAAAAVCRELAAPLTVRGGGTSIAGNAVGPGVVVDFSRHLDHVVSIDPEARSAVVGGRWVTPSSPSSLVWAEKMVSNCCLLALSRSSKLTVLLKGLKFAIAVSPGVLRTPYRA